MYMVGMHPGIYAGYTSLGTPTIPPGQHARCVYTEHAGTGLTALEHTLAERNIRNACVTVPCVTVPCVTVRESY